MESCKSERNARLLSLLLLSWLYSSTHFFFFFYIFLYFSFVIFLLYFSLSFYLFLHCGLQLRRWRKMKKGERE